MSKPSLRFRRAALSCAAIAATISSTAFVPAWANTVPWGTHERAPLPAPSQIVAEAPASEWVSIAPSDLVVMQLAPDAKGRERRVVIQLMPAPFSQGWVGNIRKLVAARWYDGVSVNRVQDNYVVQWGDANGEDLEKAKALPEGLVSVGESDYNAKFSPIMFADRWDQRGKRAAYQPDVPFTGNPTAQGAQFDDPYAAAISYSAGFPLAMEMALNEELRWPEYNSGSYAPSNVWPIHCYGMVGVGRNLSPDTGSGAELYVVIGHAPRHLDRNIALVGRVIEGIEHLSSLPRGTGPLGFYESAEERVPIVSVRMGDETPGLPAYEYLDTNKNSFAAYANARANRQDEFFIRPAGGADICNIPVPIRRKKA